jgi:polyferredoxin
MGAGTAPRAAENFVGLRMPRGVKIASLQFVTVADRIPAPPAHPIRCGPFKVTRRGLARAAVLIAVHIVIVVHVVQWRLTGTTVTPVEPSEAATTIETGFVNAGFLLFAALIAATLLFGRFFCGWACHVVAYQDLCGWLLKKAGLKPLPVRSRLLFLVPFYAAFDMFFWPTISKAWQGSAPPAFQDWMLVTPDLWERFPGWTIGILTVAVDGFLIVWWLGAKGFCNYGCPYGAFFHVADRLAPGKIRVTEDCNGCGHCTVACTSNVRVHEEVRLYKSVTDAACMKCFDCISSCPKDALYYGFGAPSLLTPPPPTKAAKHYDFSWPEEFALVAVFAGAIFAFRGLYGEVPFLLALGLASMAAFLFVGALRMVRHRDFTFQHHVLRRDGRFTASGVASCVVVAAASMVIVHCAAVQYYTKTGAALLRTAQRSDGSARVAARDGSREALLQAERIGLFENATLQLQLASIAFNRGDAAEAQSRLRRAIDTAPRLVEPWLQLAELQWRDGRRAEALETLERGARENPANAALQKRLAALQAAAPK